MHVYERLMQKLFRYWQHSHWVVVKYSVMTGTTTVVLSYFNAYNEHMFRYQNKCFFQRVSSIYMSGWCRSYSDIDNILIELWSSILLWLSQQLQCRVISIHEMNSSWGSNTNITFQVCHACIWEADAECILKETAFLWRCGQVFHNDRHDNCSTESFQCMKWTQVQVLSKMYFSKSVMNVYDRLMQKLCRYWQHSHWVVVNFSVMTGTTTEVLSHFNAYNEHKFRFQHKCFFASKCVKHIYERLMQKLCRYWQHSDWVVVNLSLMTGTTTVVQSHFNALK